MLLITMFPKAFILSIYAIYSPGHTLRCCTPAMAYSKDAAMPKNRMCYAAIENLLSDFHTVFSSVMGIP